ncbi:MAG: hypothetical protein AB1696_24030, partial [Planctomycetota bacterium]
AAKPDENAATPAAAMEQKPSEASKPEEKAPQEPEEPQDELDEAAYAAAIQPLDRLVDERKYDRAIAETNVAAAKVKGAEEHIKRKRENIERLKKQWAAIKEGINGGKIKAPMKEVSSRYAYAGDVIQVDEDGVTAGKDKIKVPVKWDRLSKADELNLRKHCCPAKDAESALALAAFCSEGTEKLFDAAEGFLGSAAEYGVDIKPFIQEIMFVRGLPAPAAKPAEEKKEAEKPKQEEDGKTAEAKPEEKPAEKKVEEEKSTPAVEPYEYRKRSKQVYRFKLDSAKKLTALGVRLPRDGKFVRGQKGGALQLERDDLMLPMRLPPEGGIIEFMIHASGERYGFGLVQSRILPEFRSLNSQISGIYLGPWRRYLGVWFAQPGMEMNRDGQERPKRGQIVLNEDFPWDKWVTVAFEWGDGARLYLDGAPVAEDASCQGMPGGIGELQFRLSLQDNDGRQIRREDPMPKITVLIDEVCGYLPKKSWKTDRH